MKSLSKLDIWAKSVLALLSVMCLTSCDEINNIINPDSKPGEEGVVNLYTDGLRTTIQEDQIIKVMDAQEELFEMRYNSNLRLEILKSSDNPKYYPSMMYVGVFNSIEDILIPAYPRWESTAEIKEKGGIIVKVEDSTDADPIYLRLYIPQGDYNAGIMTIQCQKIEIEPIEYSAPRKASIEKNKVFVVADDNPYLALFNLENAYPEMKLKSNYSGQLDAPVVTYSGEFDVENEEFPPMQGEWATKADIIENGVYYAKVETRVWGMKYVRFRITNISANGAINLIYQIATVKTS